MHTPHSYRRQSIHAVLLCLIVIIALLASSCSPKYTGCPSHKGMSGYGWLKNRETKKVFILDSNCGIICTFTDPKDMFHLKYE